MLFEQLYTIHALTTIGTIPCVYALLTNKQQATYTTLLNELKNIEARLDPSSVMIDFEIAVINSINRGDWGELGRG